MNKFLTRISWLFQPAYYQTIDEINQKSKISKRKIKKDIKKSFLNYGANYHDYKIFNFINLTPAKKETFLTSELNDYLCLKYNNTEEIILSPKIKLTPLKQINQNEELNLLNEKTNIFKILILNDKIISCILKIKLNSKEIYAPINLDTGIIDYPGVDLTKKVYERNNKNKENIFWFRIPKWPRIKRFAEKTANLIEDYKYIELNLALDKEKGPCLISCLSPSYQLYQLPIKNIKDEGIKNIIIRKEEIK